MSYIHIYTALHTNTRPYYRSIYLSMGRVHCSRGPSGRCHLARRRVHLIVDTHHYNIEVNRRQLTSTAKYNLTQVLELIDKMWLV